MAEFRNIILLAGTLFSNMRLIRVAPSINLFLARYMGKFRLLNTGGKLIIHSHLPAVNSKAFTRFIDEHLLAKTAGPSHAQISLTNVCPQNCLYCYNKGRSGELLSTAEIKGLIGELKGMGVVWLGFTGGEPLMNRDIVEIVKSVGDDCAAKLFTTGYGLTERLAAELKEAGLLYASVSLDHWKEAEHDRIRGCKGAFKEALKAIELFKKAGIHVGVSAVISREMLRKGQVREFLDFLIGLGIHEAWLSETKPASEAFWDKEAIITEEERLSLVRLQDNYNREGRITVNYLGHFEGKEHFGCNAGNKMTYIDAFGEVSPCVFTPMTFGNVREKPLSAIFTEMKGHFPSEGCCFINKNYGLLKKYYKGQSPIAREDTLRLMKEVSFSPLSVFSRMYNKNNKGGGAGMSLYRLFGLASSAVFAVVGSIFLFFPDAALSFFNIISVYFGMPQAAVQGAGFYLILASAYMYIVTVLAYLMYSRPDNDAYPFLLAQAKLASSVISIYLFLTHRPYLIYLANFIVDGFIGVAALFLMKLKKKRFEHGFENNAKLHA